MANKAIKYRLYPTKEQEEWFQKTFGCCRKIYNLMLSDKIAYYKETGKKLQTTPAQYKARLSTSFRYGYSVSRTTKHRNQ